MAIRGPEQFAEAERLLKKAEFEKNVAEKTNLLLEANARFSAAVVSAIIQTSGTEKQINRWGQHGLRE
jgi:hypothetical protein